MTQRKRRSDSTVCLECSALAVESQRIGFQRVLTRSRIELCPTGRTRALEPCYRFRHIEHAERTRGSRTLTDLLQKTVLKKYILGFSPMCWLIQRPSGPWWKRNCTLLPRYTLPRRRGLLLRSRLGRDRRRHSRVSGLLLLHRLFDGSFFSWADTSANERVVCYYTDDDQRSRRQSVRGDPPRCNEPIPYGSAFRSFSLPGNALSQPRLKMFRSLNLWQRTEQSPNWVLIVVSMLRTNHFIHSSS
jgi:hypothetical protein